MKKINVNHESCIGCGACVAIDPEHFAFNDEGLSHAITSENLESNELKNAIDSCPTCAISIEECNNEQEEATQDNEKCECECNSNDCECDCEESCCGCHHEEE